MTPTMTKALKNEEANTQRLIAEKGYKAKNYDVCAACGTFLSAFKGDYYRVQIPNRTMRLILCEDCGDQHFREDRVEKIRKV